MHDATQRSGILAGGNWIIDHVKIVDRFPAQDTLANILSESQGTGGSPYNILLDLAKLGATFPLAGVGVVGDDADGRTILNDCADHRINTAQMHTSTELPTSYTDVMTVQSNGRRTFFHCRGANAHLAPEHFDLADSNARHFHLGYLLLLDALDSLDADGMTGAARLLRDAAERGFITSVDLVSEDSDRFTAVVNPVLPYVDLLIINEIEAGRTVGIETTPHGQAQFNMIAQAAQKLFERGVRQWVVVHARQGALAMNRQGQKFMQGSVQLPDDSIAGAAGAGDAFAAGTLLGMHENWPIEKTLQLAVTAAASCLFDPTCTGGILPLNDCLALGEQYGYRTIE